ncbi:MAG TPA: MFS transporter [Ktedonobacteraceae bacterium]|nr:MFS transporter [Ktedonobacteraceae bacterium]
MQQTETLTAVDPGPVPPGRGLLINRNFALLAAGQAISNIGDFVYSTTLLIWVFALTHSAAAVSGVLVAQYAPVFLLGPIAGVFVDRWDRRRTMVVSDMIRALVSLLPLIAPAPLRLPAIYASVAVIAGCGRFFMPAKSAVLQVIVADRQQPQAASISQATFALSIIVGPALASPLYFVVGPVVAVLINAASYLVSALSLLALRAPRRALHPYAFQRDRGTVMGIDAVLGELRSGFGFVVKTRTLLMIVVMALVAMLGSGSLNALDIVFVSRNLHVSTSIYGFLVAVGGIGALAGAIGAGVMAKWVSARRLLTGGVILTGAGITIYAFQTWYIAALVISFLMGMPQGAIEVGFGPLLIKSTPRVMMGRAQSVIDTSMYAASLISIGLSGYLGQFLPVNVIFAACGILIALSGILGWFSIPEPQQPAGM